MHGAVELRRPLVAAYAATALAFSAALASFALRRGTGELAAWLAAYAVLAALSLRAPERAPLAAGAAALLVGFVRTYRSGFNLDLGLGLIAFAVAVYLFGRLRTRSRLRTDLGGLMLLAIAASSLVSLGFTLARVRAFAPAPGFAYHTYQFNAAGYASDEALIRAVIGATVAFLWFGLYEYARSARIERRLFNGLVFGLLLANTAALLVQRFVMPEFLYPPGWPPGNRLNGVTSFCYALGDAVVALYLLLPAWGLIRGAYAAMTAASVAMLVYAAVASGSRTAFFTMLAVTVLWACAHGVGLSRARRGRTALASVAAAALLAGATLAAYRLTPPDHVSPLGRLRADIEREGLVGHLVSQRLASYPLLFRVLEAYPLSGVGAGLYPAEASKQAGLLAPGLRFDDPFMLSSFASNQFLNTGVELGVAAMAALVFVFAWAAAAPWRSRREAPAPGSHFTVSLVALAGALQLGPALNNSEALVFLWLIVGAAARGRAFEAAAPGEAEAGAAAARPALATAVVAGTLVLSVAGQLWSAPKLAVERQWQQLRWRIGMGMLPQQPDGRWSRPEATFSLDLAAPAAALRWHVGDPSTPDYRASVSWYVDGSLVETTLARPGLIRESVLPLPLVAGYKRISVKVTPPFEPRAARLPSPGALGVFVHSITPRPASAGTASR